MQLRLRENQLTGNNARAISAMSIRAILLNMQQRKLRLLMQFGRAEH